jgi:hypothetical protein
LIGIVSRHDLLKPSTAVFAEEREREQFRHLWTSPSTTLRSPHIDEETAKEPVSVARQKISAREP